MARTAANANMQQMTFRFHGRLVNYLGNRRQAGSHGYVPQQSTAVKHPIEAMGVPHTEVDCILANGQPVGFAYILREADCVDVYPAIPSEVVVPVRLRQLLTTPVRFVADNHVGRLATYLRLLGFDVLHPKELGDAELAELSASQGRVLLSRDKRLLMRKIIVHGFCLQSRDPRQQLSDVLDRFNLHRAIAPWKRCLRCNGRLRPVAKDEIIERLEPKTKKYYHEFHMCQVCRQIYWKGSHYEPLHDFVGQVLNHSLDQDSV